MVHGHVRSLTPVARAPPIRRPMPLSLSYSLDTTLGGEDSLWTGWMELEFPASALLVEEISLIMAPLAAAGVLFMRTPLSGLMQTSIIVGLLCGAVPSMGTTPDVGSAIAQVATRFAATCLNFATMLVSRLSKKRRTKVTAKPVAALTVRAKAACAPTRPGLAAAKGEDSVKPLKLPPGLSLWGLQDHSALSHPR